jgi:integrase
MPKIIEKFLSSKTNQTTRRNYQSDLRQFAIFKWELPPLEYEPKTRKIKYDPLKETTDEQWLSIGADDIRAYMVYAKGAGLSTGTISRRITAIKSFLDEAAANGLYDETNLNYIKNRVKPENGESSHHLHVTPEDQNKLLEAASKPPGIKGLRDYLIIRLLLETGVRRFELLNLKCKHLSVEGGQPGVFVDVAKNNQSRRIPISKEIYELIQRWLSESGQNISPDNPIFCRVRRKYKGKEDYIALCGSKPLSVRFLNLLVTNLVKISGIKGKVTPHSFRVSAVTDAVEAKAQISHIRQMTGHSDTRMIDQIYNRYRYSKPLPKKHELFRLVK